MRSSNKAAIREYLEQADERLKLDDLDETDLEKVLEKIQKAQEKLEQEIE